MTFRVGQKVARIGGIDKHNCAPPLHKPVTVSNVYRSWMGIVLIEIAEYPTQPILGVERGFNPRFFRAVVEHTTDISVFKKMLTPSKVPA